jgi:hypothetical protein
MWSCRNPPGQGFSLLYLDPIGFVAVDDAQLTADLDRSGHVRATPIEGRLTDPVTLAEVGD